MNEFVKRVRAAKIHCLIMGHLRKQMPYFGQKKAQEKLMDNLANEFRQVQREYHLHAGKAGVGWGGVESGLTGGRGVHGGERVWVGWDRPRQGDACGNVQIEQGLRSCIWIQHPPDAIANVIHPADAGDFPDVNRYRDILSAFDISKFTKLDKSMIKQVSMRRWGSSSDSLRG